MPIFRLFFWFYNGYSMLKVGCMWQNQKIAKPDWAWNSIRFTILHFNSVYKLIVDIQFDWLIDANWTNVYYYMRCMLRYWTHANNEQNEKNSMQKLNEQMIYIQTNTQMPYTTSPHTHKLHTQKCKNGHRSIGGE